MNKIRKGDEVIVLTGRDKGKRGTVSLRKDDSRIWSSTASTWSRSTSSQTL
jgi:ribosomal protein L24